MHRVILFGSILCCAILATTNLELASEDPTVQSSSEGQAEQGSTSPEFKQAGVCARCHVVSVLEWSVSGHVAAGTRCQDCHGSSAGHVANERNEVKPDRLPRGEAIAAEACAVCHDAGCPETEQAQNCQQCHHVHALIDPAKPRETDHHLDRLLARWQQLEQHLTTGDQHARLKDWTQASAEYRAALKLFPNNPAVREKLEMCLRRLHPAFPGFEIAGPQFDEKTGLPREVRIVELNTSMILVSPGQFDIGSDSVTSSRPVHTVAIDAFYLGQHEVTQGLWKTVMGENPSVHQGATFGGDERRPVERVSWDDCQQFMQRLNSLVAGGGFRLPTEAEWEFACRAGGGEHRPDGANRTQVSLRHRAWYRGNALRERASLEATFPITSYAPRPVGMLEPNRWGFYDMQGNVAEWTSSLFRPYLYDSSDGRELLTAKGMRVLRGGGFGDSRAALDPAARHAQRPQRRLRWNGLRLARSVPSLPGS